LKLAGQVPRPGRSIFCFSDQSSKGRASELGRNTPGIGVLKRHSSQPCRKCLKTMYGAASKPRPFKAPAADFEVFPQAV
jgi:hypothetical protein